MAAITYSSEHLLAVVLLSSVKRIIDKGEAGGSATTELSLETENRNVLLLGLEGLGQLGLDVGLRDVGLLGVDELNHLKSQVRVAIRTYALFPLEKRVLHEFASVQNKLLVCHFSKRTSNLPYLINNNHMPSTPIIYTSN